MIFNPLVLKFNNQKKFNVELYATVFATRKITDSET